MYINSFCAAVPDDNKGDYIKHAKVAAGIMREQGAIRCVETWGDNVPDGELTSFPKAVKCEPGESVVLGWVEWPDKETSDKGMGAMMQDERMAGMELPFDGKRLLWGGCNTILAA